MSNAQVIRCANCGALNRVPDEKLAQGLKPVCGRWERPLTGIKPATVTDATFQQVERSPLPVLLDIWAPWCGPCRYISPVVDQLATELAGRVFVAKLNADENRAITARFNIQGISVLLVLHERKRG
jgi:thioredoxin 2